MCEHKEAWDKERQGAELPSCIGKFWPYILTALVIILLTTGCSKPSCTDTKMQEWRANNPNAGHSEASYRYRRIQLECKEE